MWWLWIVGPILVGIIYAVTAGRDRRIEAEVERFRAKLPEGAKKIMSLPGPLHRMVLAAGGGEAVQRIELVPKLAYLASMAANAVCLSDHQTVVCKLEDAAPRFSVRPLPIVEGERIVNTGVEFKKDAEFMALFLTEATMAPASPLSPAPAPSADSSKKIRNFLSRPIRDALRELPDAWLRVEDKALALTIYSPIDADRIHQLVSVADVIFAEYGAGGGPSLLGEDDDDEEEAEEEVKEKSEAKEKTKAKEKEKSEAKPPPPA